MSFCRCNNILVNSTSQTQSKQRALEDLFQFQLQWMWPRGSWYKEPANTFRSLLWHFQTIKIQLCFDWCCINAVPDFWFLLKERMDYHYEFINRFCKLMSFSWRHCDWLSKLLETKSEVWKLPFYFRSPHISTIYCITLFSVEPNIYFL